MEYGNSAKCTAVETRPIIDELFEGAQNASGRLSAVVNRLQRLNDKIFGPRLEEVSKASVPVPTPPGAAPALRAELDELHRQLEKADHLLTNIERFV